MEAGATLCLPKEKVDPLLLKRAIRFAIERKAIENQLKTSNERLSNELADRERAEDQLRQSNEALLQSEYKVKEIAGRLQAVLENWLDVPYRRNLQTDQYDYMSPAVAQILGFSADEMMNMSIEDALACVHPDDLPIIKEQLEGLAQAGQARLEYRFRRKDGDYSWVADHVTVTKDAAGNLLYRTGTLRDITSQKQAQEQNRQQKDLLERLV